MPADDTRDAGPNRPATGVRWTAGFDAGDRTADLWAYLARRQRTNEGIERARWRRAARPNERPTARIASTMHSAIAALMMRIGRTSHRRRAAQHARGAEEAHP